MNNLIDAEDYRILLGHVLSQAIDDYVKLQHPKYRQKKYLQEAFLNAVDLFFDPEYRMLRIKNGNGEDMSLEEMLQEILQEESVDIKRLQQFVIEKTKAYWIKKKMKTFTIPETVCVQGEVYSVCHTEDLGYRVDYDERKIHLNRTGNESSQRALLAAGFELVCYYEDLAISRDKRQQLGHGVFDLLKVNGTFRE